MRVLHLVLLIVAAILFGLAAFTQPNARVNLVAAGLLAWVLVPLSDAVASA